VHFQLRAPKARRGVPVACASPCSSARDDLETGRSCRWAGTVGAEGEAANGRHDSGKETAGSRGSTTSAFTTAASASWRPADCSVPVAACSLGRRR
jgi:hypothetical protein